MYENYKRMFVPEGKPEVGDEKEALRATVFYHIVQVGHPNLAPLAYSSRCRAHGRALKLSGGGALHLPASGGAQCLPPCVSRDLSLVKAMCLRPTRNPI